MIRLVILYGIEILSIKKLDEKKIFKIGKKNLWAS